MLNRTITAGFTLALMLTVSSAPTYAVIVDAFENGEVFDGRAGPRDGVGDELFFSIGSYFNSLSQGVAGYSGQTMSYFDITGIDNASVTAATFLWTVDFAFESGAPDSSSLHGLANDGGLSLDDFNKGSLIESLVTAGFGDGDVISVDVTSFIQSFSGDFVGFRLSSNDPDTAERFLNMHDVGQLGAARLDITEVPLPAALPLFSSTFGLIGLLSWRRRKITSEGTPPIRCMVAMTGFRDVF